MDTQLSVLEEFNGNEDPGVYSEEDDDSESENYENNNYDELVGVARSDPLKRRQLSARSYNSPRQLPPLDENEASSVPHSPLGNYI